MKKRVTTKKTDRLRAELRADEKDDMIRWGEYTISHKKLLQSMLMHTLSMSWDQRWAYVLTELSLLHSKREITGEQHKVFYHGLKLFFCKELKEHAKSADLVNLEKRAKEQAFEKGLKELTAIGWDADVTKFSEQKIAEYAPWIEDPKSAANSLRVALQNKKPKEIRRRPSKEMRRRLSHGKDIKSIYKGDEA